MDGFPKLKKFMKNQSQLEGINGKSASAFYSAIEHKKHEKTHSRKEEMIMFRVFITNLGKYNEGELIGKWLDLPCEDTEEELASIGVSDEPDEKGNYYEEYFITDYENDYGYKVGEYDSLDDLNEIAEELENLDEYDKEIVNAFIENGSNVEEALERFRDGDYMLFSNCSDMTDVAYQYIEETGLLDGVPEILKNYFDYEAYGRDMSYEGTFIFTDNGNCVELF